MKIVATLQDILKNGNWEAFCELKGLSSTREPQGGELLAEYDLSMQEAVDVGLMPGKKTPRKVMAMSQATKPVMSWAGNESGSILISAALAIRRALSSFPWPGACSPSLRVVSKILICSVVMS